MRSLLRHLPLLLLLGAIWGLTPSIAKLAMQQGMMPLGVASVSSSVSAVVLVAHAAWRGDAPRATVAHLRHYLAGGLVGLALANLFGFTGLSHAPASLFALIVPLSTLFTVALFALFGLEKAGPRGWAGTVLGLAGVALAMAPGAALPDPSLIPWAALMVLTPACYAAANLLSVRLAVPGTTALSQAAGTLAGAGVSATLLAALLGHLSWPGGPGVAALLLLQGVLTALAYLVYFHLLVTAGGVVTSQSAYLVTLAGLGWAFLLFGEVPGWLTLPAAALVFAGLSLLRPGNPRPRRASPVRTQEERA